MCALSTTTRLKRRARPHLRALRRLYARSPAAALAAIVALVALSVALALALLSLRGLPIALTLPTFPASSNAAAAGEDTAPRRPRVYVATWGDDHRAQLQHCVSVRLPKDARTPSLGSFDLPLLRSLGVTSATPDSFGLDTLLFRKFGSYSQRTSNMSEADFFYISSPLSLLVDCMRASNEEERRQGVSRGRRVYPKLAMHFANTLFSDVVNSAEYALAVQKKYPALILAQTEYARELEILAEGSPFWRNIAHVVLRVTPELPQHCAGGYFLQVPYPAHVKAAQDNIAALQRAAADEKRNRDRVAYYAGSCTKTRAHSALCEGLRAAEDADALADPRRSPLESVPEQPKDHFSRLADAAFCPQPGARARTRRDFYNAALLGCLPALFRADSDAYSRVLAPAHVMPDFAVVVGTDSGRGDETVAEKLRKVQPKQVQALRAALADALPRLQYASRQDEAEDAFAGILDNLAVAMRKPEQFACGGETREELN